MQRNQQIDVEIWSKIWKEETMCELGMQCNIELRDRMHCNIEMKDNLQKEAEEGVGWMKSGIGWMISGEGM